MFISQHCWGAGLTVRHFLLSNKRRTIEENISGEDVHPAASSFTRRREAGEEGR